MKHHFFYISIWLGLVSNGAFAAAAASSTQTIQQDTSTYSIHIKYPQKYEVDNINKVVKAFIDNSQNKFLKDTTLANQVPADAPGKTSLNIDYKTAYESKDALSLLFEISQFNRGAAHPENSIVALNFINGHPVSMSQLFQSSGNNLTKIADYCQTRLLAKNFPDKKWVLEGTKPTPGNYKHWYFAKEGLAILFPATQVAPSVYGPQIVIVPVTIFEKWLNHSQKNAVWGK